MFLKEIITVIVQIKAPYAAAASLTKYTKRRRRRGSYRKHKNQGPWSRFLSDGKCALKWKVKWWSVFSSMNGIKRWDGTEECFTHSNIKHKLVFKSSWSLWNSTRSRLVSNWVQFCWCVGKCSPDNNNVYFYKDFGLCNHRTYNKVIRGRKWLIWK